jgi:error-prone DNA polymerase
VKGLSVEEGRCIETSRAEKPFQSIEDFTRRTQLGEKALKRLAESGALDGFDRDRRQSLWSVLELGRTKDRSLPLSVAEPSPVFEPLDDFEIIAWDYRTSYHSTRGHPLDPLRKKLTAMRLPDARGINDLPDGHRVSYAGVVICRQRPGTAGGVVFMTLEDETGFVNLVIWESVFKRYSVLAKTAALLGVTGKLQSQSGVVHVIAETLWAPKLRLAEAASRSRDFH